MTSMSYSIGNGLLEATTLEEAKQISIALGVPYVPVYTPIYSEGASAKPERLAKLKKYFSEKRGKK